MLFRAHYLSKSTGAKAIWSPGIVISTESSDKARHIAIAKYGDKVIVTPIYTLTCYHHSKSSGELCGWVWQYSGRRTQKATCPSCFKQVDIMKARCD